MLRPDRIEEITINYFIRGSSERGRIVELLPERQMIDGNSYEEVQAGRHDGVPIGVLLEDVVNVDLCKTPIHHWSHTTVPGSKVTILQRGVIVTDQISGKGWEENPSCVGKKVYYTRNGKFTLYRVSKPVGICMSRKDENGYVQIRITL